MKKTLILFLLCAVSIGTYSHSGAQVRFLFDLQSDFNMDEFSFESILNDSFADSNWIYWGLTTEIVIKHTGFGVTGLINMPTGTMTDKADTAFSWDGGVFLNYHLFGPGKFLDPYFGMGVNCAGGIFIPRSDLYGEANWGKSSWDPVNNLTLSIYPYVSAGLGIDLGGLLFGAKLAYQPLQFSVGGLSMYRSPYYSLDLYGGFALGGHK